MWVGWDDLNAHAHLYARLRSAGRNVIVLSVLLAAQPAAALDPGKAVSQYVHASWSVDDGLPSGQVRAIAQIDDGYLWVGTQDGFARFDGLRFTVYDRRTVPALRADFITSLAPDGGSALWVGTAGGGLSRMQHNRLVPFGRDGGLASDRVLAVHVDGEGTTWVGTYDGLSRIGRDGDITTFTETQGLAGNIVTDIAQGPGGTLWIATARGLSRLQDGVIDVFTRADGLPSDNLATLYPARDGTLWIGTADAGLSRLVLRSDSAGFIQPRFESVELPVHARTSLRAITEDRDENIWVGSDGDGLFRINADGVSRYSVAEGLSDNAVLALHEDREGSLWVGTRRGLDRLRDGSFTTYAQAEGLSFDFVVNVYEDRAGTLWIGTNAGLNRIDEGRITVYTTADGLADDRIRSLGGDRHGNLWVGAAAGGLTRFRDGRGREVLTTANGLPHDVIISILEDREGGLWVGSDGGGLARYADGKFTAYTTNDGLAGDFVFALLQDTSGTLWAGTDQGLSRLRAGRVVPPLEEDPLSGISIQSLHEGQDGTLWIGTRSQGLFRLTDDEFSRYTTRQGLYSDAVHSALEDKRGDLWLSSNKGVARLKRSELDAIAAGRSGRLRPVVFGRPDGMKNSEANGGGQPSGWKARDGRLWFATMGGAVVIDPANLIGNHLPPPVIIESIVADDRSQPLFGSIRLAPGTQRLDLEYTATSLAVPEQVRFRYRLVGFDDAWVNAGVARSAHFTNLSPGGYTFEVIAANESGVWNKQGAVVAFELVPRFYQTNWFYLLCVLTGALLLYGLHHVRVAWLRARAGVLEERHRIAREIHDSLVQGLCSVGLQIEAAQRRLHRSPDLVEGHLRTAKSLVKSNLDEARRSLWELSSRLLDEMNLHKALAATAQQVSQGGLHEIRVQVCGTAWPLLRDAENHVLRIVQEAVSNAIQHGKARSIVVTLNYAFDHLTLEVADDGVGFAAPAPPPISGRGFGLRSIAGRVRALRGQIETHSTAGSGTRLSVRIPRRHRMWTLWGRMRATSTQGMQHE